MLPTKVTNKPNTQKATRCPSKTKKTGVGDAGTSGSPIMKSGGDIYVHREWWLLAWMVRLLWSGCLSGAVRVSAKLIRAVTCCAFYCRWEWAADSSRRLKIRPKGTIMQPGEARAAAYKAGLSPQRDHSPARPCGPLSILPGLPRGLCNGMLHCSSS